MLSRGAVPEFATCAIMHELTRDLRSRDSEMEGGDNESGCLGPR